MDIQPIEPTQQLAATLTAQEWNTVMAAINELPHRIVRPIWDKLGQQLQQQSRPGPMDRDELIEIRGERRDAA